MHSGAENNSTKFRNKFKDTTGSLSNDRNLAAAFYLKELSFLDEKLNVLNAPTSEVNRAYSFVKVKNIEDEEIMMT